MEVLVIGGSRFIGPLLINKLIQHNHKVTVFNRGNIQTHYDDRVTFIKGDRDKSISIKKTFDVIVDTCAYNGRQIKEAITNLEFDFYLTISTAAVYKKTEVFPLSESFPLGTWPVWGKYNLGKVECEKILEQSGIAYASLRPVYILGAHNHLDREHFIYSKIKRGETIWIPGNGQAVIQFVFVQEVVDALVLLAENKIEGAFNCAAATSVTLYGLVEIMSEIVGKKAKIKFDFSKDREKYDAAQFPFANENFFCTNKKLKRIGATFGQLKENLEKDYKNYYKDLL